LKRRPLIPIFASLVAGILLSRCFHFPWYVLSLTAVAVGAVGLILLQFKSLRILSYLSLFLLVVVAGSLMFQARILSAHLRLPGKLPDSNVPLFIRGVVATEPELIGQSTTIHFNSNEPDPMTTRFDLTVLSLSDSGDIWSPSTGRLRVLVSGEAKGIHIGDRIEMFATLFPSQSGRNPGQRDYGRYLRAKGIEYLARVVSPEAIRGLSGGSHSRVAKQVHCAREWLRRYFTGCLPEEQNGIANALVLGARRGVSSELQQRFVRTGTMHFLAVSGLHVGLIAATGWLLGRRFRLGQKRSSLFAAVLVVVYALIVGFRPSVMRATIMSMVFLMGLFTRRQRDPLSSLSLAGIIVLVINPNDLFDIGFQFSFVAAGGMIVMLPDIRDYLRRQRDPYQQLIAQAEQSWLGRLWTRFRKYILLPALVSTVAWLAIFPIVWRSFHIVTPMAIPGNVVVGPLVSVLLLGGFVALLTGWIPLLGAMIGYCVHGLSVLLGWSVLALDHVPFGHFYTSAPGIGWVIAYYALFLTVACRRVTRVHVRYLFYAAAALAAAFLFTGSIQSKPSGVRLTVLDVGHGLSIFCEFPDGKNMLYDAGGYAPGVGESVIAPFLWHEGIGRIDTLVLSHPDWDHISGVPALVERFRIDSVFVNDGFEDAANGKKLGVLLRENGLAPVELSAGDSLDGYEDAEVEVWSPASSGPRVEAENQNDRSLVLQVFFRGQSILLTGDVEEIGVALVVDRYLDERTEICLAALLLPHHGAYFRGVEGFARLIGARLGVASCGQRGVAVETMKAFESAETRVIETKLQGAVRMTLSSDQIVVERWNGASLEWKTADVLQLMADDAENVRRFSE